MSTKPARTASNPHLGADFDDCLREEGLYDEAQAIAVRRVLAYELERGMVKAQLTKQAGEDLARQRVTAARHGDVGR